MRRSVVEVTRFVMAAFRDSDRDLRHLPNASEMSVWLEPTGDDSTLPSSSSVDTNMCESVEWERDGLG